MKAIGTQIDFREECERHCICNDKYCDRWYYYQYISNPQEVGGDGEKFA